MAAISWKMNVNGDWSDALDWSPSVVPTDISDVTIGVGGAYTVTVSDAESANSLTLSGSNSTLAVNASLAISGALTQTSGAIGGTGVVTFGGAATLTGGAENGTGTSDFKGATTVGAAGQTGNSQFYSGNRIVDNDGSLTWLGGTFVMEGATINNRAGAVFNAEGDDIISNTAGTNLLTNAGTLEKSAGAGVTQVEIAFNNSGAVLAKSGTLEFDGGGSSSGSFVVGAGATLAFGGGGVYHVTGGAFTGTGTLLVNSSIGALDFDGTIHVAPALTQTSGAIGGTGVVTFGGAATLTGGAENGTGTSDFKGATTVGAAGQTGNSQFYSGNRIVDNDGSLTWLGGTFVMEGATINNRAGAVFNAEGDDIISNTAGTNLLTNAGTLEKSAGAGVTQVEIAFNNSGAVLAKSGTLEFDGGGSSSGSFVVGAGATLAFGGGGVYHVTGGAFTGTGTLLVNSSIGALDFDGTIHVAPALTQTSGAIGGTGLVTFGGAATLTGGAENGTGTSDFKGATTVGAAGQTGNSQFYSGNRIVDNDGSLTWLGGTFVMEGATINNRAGAVFNAEGDDIISNTAGTNLLTNAGTLEKSAGAGVTQVEIAFNNSGAVLAKSGTLEFDGGGSSSGSFVVGAGATLAFGGGGVYHVTGGAFTGTGTLLVNSSIGALDFDGTIHVAPALTQTSGAIGGTGLVTFGGAATLTGGAENGTGTSDFKGATTVGAAGQTGNSQFYSGNRIVDNDGSLTWLGGAFVMEGATINNRAGAVFNAEGDDIISNTAGTNLLTNAGTLEKSAGAGVTQVEIAFNNSGAVLAKSGTLEFDGGGSSSGSFVVGAGATLAFGGGGVYHVTGGAFTGTGTLLVNSSIGALDFDGTIHVAPALTQTSGAIGGTGVVTFGGAATLTGGAENGTGTSDFKGATTVGAAGQTGNSQFYSGNRIVDNDGSLTWLGGAFVMEGATINNRAGAVFNAEGDDIISNTAGTNLLTNAGTLEKSAGAGVTQVEIAFNNSGAVLAKSGTLEFDGGGSSSGSFVVGAGATLAFGGGGVYHVTGGAFTGTGTLLVNSSIGALDFDGTIHVAPALTQTSGAIGGTGLVTFGGAATLTGGAENGTGTSDFKGATTVGAAGQTGNSQFYSGNRIVDNDGSLTWLGGAFVMEGATINNRSGAVFNAEGDDIISNTAGTNLLTNAGTLEKSAGAGVTQVEIAFNNSGAVLAKSGTLEFDGGGSSSGTFVVVSGATLDFAGGAGYDVAGHITSNGTIEANSGLLELLGGVSGLGTLQIGHATLELAGTVTEAAMFASGTTGTLQLDVPTTFTGAIDGLAINDAIRFSDETLNSASIVGNTLTVVGSAGTTHYTVNGALTNDHFAIQSDAHTIVLTAGAAPAAESTASGASLLSDASTSLFSHASPSDPTLGRRAADWTADAFVGSLTAPDHGYGAG